MDFSPFRLRSPYTMADQGMGYRIPSSYGMMPQDPAASSGPAQNPDAPWASPQSMIQQQAIYGPQGASPQPQGMPPPQATPSPAPGASQALQAMQNAGGMIAPPPMPPVRPQGVGNQLNFMNPQSPSTDTPGMGPSAPPPGPGAPPSGSNLAQGPGQPGQGLQGFMHSIFGHQAPQGSPLGMQSGHQVFSGDPQSSLPGFMKGSKVANFLQMLGAGGF